MFPLSSSTSKNEASCYQTLNVGPVLVPFLVHFRVREDLEVHPENRARLDHKGPQDFGVLGVIVALSDYPVRTVKRAKK